MKQQSKSSGVPVVLVGLSMFGAAAPACDDAGPIDTANQSKLVASDSVSAFPADDPDYLATPRGRFHRSCVHEVPDGARVENHRIVLDGRTIKNVSPCAYPVDGRSPPLVNGWVEASEANATDWFTEIYAEWVVPPWPSYGYRNSQLIYFFPRSRIPQEMPSFSLFCSGDSARRAVVATSFLCLLGTLIKQVMRSTLRLPAPRRAGTLLEMCSRTPFAMAARATGRFPSATAPVASLCTLRPGRPG